MVLLIPAQLSVNIIHGVATHQASVPSEVDIPFLIALMTIIITTDCTSTQGHVMPRRRIIRCLVRRVVIAAAAGPRRTRRLPGRALLALALVATRADMTKSVRVR